MPTNMGLHMRYSLILAALVCSSCGPAGPLSSNAASDFGTVYLYMINAYPGASEMTLETSHDAVKNVGFGERVGGEGLCPPSDATCLPKLVDRTDGVFETRFDSERGTVSLREEIQAMYPQETGTAVFTAPDRAVLLRHPQTISSTCGLNIVNGLAVEEHGSEASRFEVAIEVRRTPTEAGFAEEEARPFVGPCGVLPSDTVEHEQLVSARQESLAGIIESPWFFPVVCPDGGPGTCFGWGQPSSDERATVGPNGAVEVLRDAESFYTCIETAMSRSGACSGESTWANVALDARDVDACLAPTVMMTPIVAPLGVERLEGDNLCDVTFRTRTAGRDLVFGPAGGDAEGSHSDGALIETTVSAPLGSDHFWVLYGRPVNPRVWQWDAADAFVVLEHYPDPGE